MKCYTTQEVADMFKVSAATIRREIERKKLNCFYVGNEARFTQSHIDEYTAVKNFEKTKRELELEAEKERLVAVINEYKQIIENIKNTLLKERVIQ